jgi:hypothetical protein
MLGMVSQRTDMKFLSVSWFNYVDLFSFINEKACSQMSVVLKKHAQTVSFCQRLGYLSLRTHLLKLSKSSSLNLDLSSSLQYWPISFICKVDSVFSHDISKWLKNVLNNPQSTICLQMNAVAVQHVSHPDHYSSCIVEIFSGSLENDKYYYSKAVNEILIV